MPRGSKPGERRGGRKAGVPNKAAGEVKALAQQHGPAAILELARLFATSESHPARVAAANSILDRAYGKSAPSPEEREDAANILKAVINVGIAPKS